MAGHLPGRCSRGLAVLCAGGRAGQAPQRHPGSALSSRGLTWSCLTVTGRFGGSPSWGVSAPPPGAVSSLKILASTWGSPSPMRLGTGMWSYHMSPSSGRGADSLEGRTRLAVGSGRLLEGARALDPSLDPSGSRRVGGKGWEIWYFLITE